MEIKKITNNILSFIIKRFIEIFGFCVSLLGLALLASLLTYSPEDPNFVFLVRILKLKIFWDIGEVLYQISFFNL